MFFRFLFLLFCRVGKLPNKIKKNYLQFPCKYSGVRLVCSAISIPPLGFSLESCQISDTLSMGFSIYNSMKIKIVLWFWLHFDSCAVLLTLKIKIKILLVLRIVIESNWMSILFCESTWIILYLDYVLSYDERHLLSMRFSFIKTNLSLTNYREKLP